MQRSSGWGEIITTNWILKVPLTQEISIWEQNAADILVVVIMFHLMLLDRGTTRTYTCT